MDKNGLLSKYLNTMQDMDLITKNYPINAKEDNKKSYYELNDNLVRFYYTYIYSNKTALNLLGPNNFYNEYIAPSILTFISHQFEKQGKMYFSLCLKKGILNNVLDVGTYYYVDSKNKKHKEFDIVLKKKDIYEIYEVKFYRNQLLEKEMIKEDEQVSSIKGINAKLAGFITVYEVEKKLDKFNYINGNDLYFLNK